MKKPLQSSVVQIEKLAKSFYLTLLLQSSKYLYARRSLFIITLLFVVAGVTESQGQAWYNSSWSNRKQITINASKVGSGTHANFPILISITDANLKTTAQSDGDDIFFTSSNGTTKIAHEIESYSGTTGALVAWVKITSLPSSSNTDIYMYYGNASVSSQENVTGTWETSFKGVWHLNGAFGDATSNNNNGTNGGTTSATGKISGGRDFAKADGDYIAIPGLMGSPSNATLSAWANLDARDVSGAQVISLGDHLGLDFSDPTYGGLGFAYIGSNWSRTVTNTSYALTGWHYLSYTFDNTNRVQRFFVDGVQVASTTFTGSINYSGLGSSTRIGGHAAGSAAYDFDGKIDEVRVASAARAAGWVLTEYNNQNSPSTFYTVGSEACNLTTGTPTAIAIASGSQPTCQLTNGTTTTTYATTATNSTGYNWSLSNASAGSINASTGVMTWANGFAGTVNIQVTATGCGGTSSQVVRTVTIATAPSATISYTGSPFCKSLSSAQSVSRSGTAGGTYSSTTGLTINASTGAITPSTSTVGTYTITYTMAAAGGCAAQTATTSVTISAAPYATGAYPGSPYCVNGGMALPTGSVSAPGVITSTTGLSINSSTGVVDLGASTPGTYSVTYTIPASGSCPAFAVSYPITITAVPSATISYSGAPFCQSLAAAQSVTQTGTTGGTYSSTTGLTINASTGAITPSTSTAGTYTVTYTIAAAGGCAAYTTTANVVVSAVASASITYSGTPYCATARIAGVTHTGTPGGTYSSTAGLALNSSTGAVDLGPSIAGTYTVTYTVAASGGCSGFTATTSIQLAPISNNRLNFVNGANGVICATPGEGSSATLTAPAGTVFTTVDFASYGNPAGSCSAFTFGSCHAVNSHSITEGYLLGNSSAIIPATNSVFGDPCNGTSKRFYVQATYTQPICSGTAPGVITGTAPSGGNGSYTYFWEKSTTGSTSGFVAANGTNNSINYTPGVLTETTWFRRTVTSNGCSDSKIILVAVTPAPATPTIAYSSPAFCKSLATAQDVLQTGTAGGTYSSTAGLSINSSTGAITPSTSTVGTYTVTYTIAAANGCNAQTATTSVTITAIPSATISYSSSTFCKSIVTGQAVSQSGTTGGTYSSTAGLTINAATGAITPSTSTVGTYAVTYTMAAAGGCAAQTATTSVTITAAPYATGAYPGSPYCVNGGMAIPTGSVSAPGVITSTTGLSINSSTGVVNLGASTPGTYSVTYTIPASGSCPAFAVSYPITITAAPSATISYTGGSFCTSGTTVEVNRTGTAGGTYSSTTGLSINASTGLITLSVSTAGTYTVTYTIAAANGCAAVIATTSVTITEAPSATISYTGSPFCTSGTTAAVIRSGTSGGTYASTAGLSISSATGEINLAASTPGTYTISYTIGAANGCAAVQAGTTVVISAAANATIGYSAASYCDNAGTATMSLTGTTGGIFTSTAGLSLNATTGNITLATSTSGTYIVTYSIAANGACAAFSTSTTISVVKVPAVTNATTSSVCSGNSPNISLTASAPANFSWTLGTITGGVTGASAGSGNVINQTLTSTGSTAGTVQYIITPTSTASAYSGVRTVGNQVYEERIGSVFTANSPVQITSLGAFDDGQNGLVGTIQVGIVRNSDGVTVAGPISMTGSTDPLENNYRMRSISPVTLPAGVYTVVAVGYNASEKNGNAFFDGIKTTTNSGGGVITFNSSLFGGMGIGLPTTYYETSNGFHAGTFKFSTGCTGAPKTITVSVAPANTATIAYASTAFCRSTETATVTRTGTAGGTYTSTAGLTINAATGAITPSASTVGTYAVTYTMAAAGECAAQTATTSVTITAAPYATGAYPGSPYCVNGGMAIPTGSVSAPGVITSTTGLSINSSTGVVNLGASTPGTYSVTYTIPASGSCPAFAVSYPITITAVPSATISYAGTPFCKSLAIAQSVTQTGTTGGTYTSTTGLTINAGTGAITPSTSIAGTYTVTYTMAAAGGCAAQTATTSVTITALPTATISYSSATFCKSLATAQAVSQSGTPGGTYSSTAGLTINSSTGAITPSTSTVGTYTVTYTMAAAGGCAAQTATTSVTITALPTASISYGSPFCKSTIIPQPVSQSGATGGTYSTTAGLTIDPITGAITPSTSTLGTYTVTYTMAATGGCAAQTATTSVTIAASPSATISYPQSPYCTSQITAAVERSGTAGGTYTCAALGLNINAITGAINLTTVAAGTYTVTYTITAANGCSQFTTTATITVASASSATITYGVSAYCTEGSNPTVTRVGTQGGIYSSTAGLSINASTGIITAASSTPGTYTVSYALTPASGCSPSTATAPVTIVAAGVWSGAVSTDWALAANWSCNSVPSKTTDVIIPAGLSKYPTLTSTTKAVRNLTIGSGAKIKLSASILQVAGTITNSGSIDAANGGIEMNGSSPQVIPAGLFAGNNLTDLTISNTAGVTLGGTVNLTDILSINAGSLETGGYLVLKSTTLNTARVSEITSSSATPITGNVTVERYVPGRRKYRLITSAVTTNTSAVLTAGQENMSIWGNWQNGGISTSQNVGTLITGGTSADGFDTQTSNPSLYTYNASTKKFVAFSSANGNKTKYTSLRSGVAYYMFVYGDRQNSVSTTTPRPTVLSATGKLATGLQVFNTSSVAPITSVVGNFSLIGNPYACTLDWKKVKKNNISSTIWGWDAGLNSTGGYVTVTATLAGAIVSPISALVNVSRYVQPGQGFFVQTTGSNPYVEIAENNKIKDKENINSNVFRGADVNVQPLMAFNILYTSAGNPVLADGAVAAFDAGFSNAINDEDGLKMQNSTESISIEKAGQLLSIDARPTPQNNDTIFLNTARITKLTYTLEIFASEMESSNLQPYLEDAYLKTSRLLSLTDTNRIVFTTIASNLASRDVNRFRIVFKQATILPVTFTSIKAALTNSNVKVEWNVATETGIVKYEVEHSSDGVNFVKVAEVHSRGNSITASYNWLHANVTAANNYYRVRAVQHDGQYFFSKLVVVKTGVVKTQIKVFPNPVKNQKINLQFTSAEKGEYSMILYNQHGQRVITYVINHAGGSLNQAIPLKTKLPAGLYYMRVFGKKDDFNQNIIIE